VHRLTILVQCVVRNWFLKVGVILVRLVGGVSVFKMVYASKPALQEHWMTLPHSKKKDAQNFLQ